MHGPSSPYRYGQEMRGSMILQILKKKWACLFLDAHGTQPCPINWWFFLATSGHLSSAWCLGEERRAISQCQNSSGVAREVASGVIASLLT